MPTGQRLRLSEGFVDQLEADYRTGRWAQEDLGFRWSISQGAVGNRLQRRGCTRPRRNNRDGHGHWKGGRTVTSGGYVGVRIDSDHPFASMRHISGYVLEHRLRMAEKLGRPLHPDETVHHKDGDRTNNEASNLEVWVGRHGKGATSPHCRTCVCLTES